MSKIQCLSGGKHISERGYNLAIILPGEVLGGYQGARDTAMRIAPKDGELAVLSQEGDEYFMSAWRVGPEADIRAMLNEPRWKGSRAKLELDELDAIVRGKELDTLGANFYAVGKHMRSLALLGIIADASGKTGGRARKRAAQARQELHALSSQ